MSVRAAPGQSPESKVTWSAGIGTFTAGACTVDARLFAMAAGARLPAGARTPRTRWRPRRCAAVAAIVVGYSTLVAVTRSFTWPANIVTAVGLSAMALAVALQAQPRPPLILARRSHPASGPPGNTERGRMGWLAWAALLTATAGWEIASWARSPRHDHPTLSAFLDAIDASAFGRGATAAAWLVTGWYLVTR